MEEVYEEEDEEKSSRYPKLSIIIAKKGRPPPCSHSNMQIPVSELAYLNGESGKKADVGCRI